MKKTERPKCVEDTISTADYITKLEKNIEELTANLEYYSKKAERLEHDREPIDAISKRQSDLLELLYHKWNIRADWMGDKWCITYKNLEDTWYTTKKQFCSKNTSSVNLEIPCMHDQQKVSGDFKITNISCPCPKCSPRR